MRRRLMVMVLAIAAGANAGCIMVLGFEGLPAHKRVIEIEDELYIVDVETRTLKKLDLEAAVQDDKTIDVAID